MTIEKINESIEALSAKLADLETIKKSVADHDSAINGLSQKNLTNGNGKVETKTALDVAFDKLAETNFAAGASASIHVPFGDTLTKSVKAGTPGTVTTVQNPTVTDLGTAINGAYTYGFQTALNYVSTAGLDQAHWVRYLVGQDVGAAAVLATEIDTLPQIQPTYQEASLKAFVAGGHAKLSKAVVSSKPALQNAISIVLGRSLAKALDGALANGANGFAGITKSAKAWTSTYKDVVSAVPELMDYLARNGLANTSLVLVANPADMTALYNKQDTLGRYLINPDSSYLNPVAAQTIRGVEVRYSESVKAGEFYVILRDFYELHVSDNAVVTFGLTGNDLISNQITAVLSTRVVPVDLLDMAAIKVTLAA